MTNGTGDILNNTETRISTAYITYHYRRIRHFFLPAKLPNKVILSAFRYNARFLSWNSIDIF